MSAERRALIDAAIVAGKDPHTELAASDFGVKPEDVTPEQRRYAKTLNFRALYAPSNPLPLSSIIRKTHT